MEHADKAGVFQGYRAQRPRTRKNRVTQITNRVRRRIKADRTRHIRAAARAYNGKWKPV
jgi:hypothetical protein